MKGIIVRVSAAALSGAMLFADAPSHAQTRSEIEARHTPAYDRCMRSGDARRGVTSAILDCIGAEIDLQDRRLNTTYRTLLRRLSPQQGAALRRSERLWIAQRDARCERKSQAAEGGTLGSIIYSSCVLDETIGRTLWLGRQPAR